MLPPSPLSFPCLLPQDILISGPALTCFWLHPVLSGRLCWCILEFFLVWGWAGKDAHRSPLQIQGDVVELQKWGGGGTQSTTQTKSLRLRVQNSMCCMIPLLQHLLSLNTSASPGAFSNQGCEQGVGRGSRITDTGQPSWRKCNRAAGHQPCFLSLHSQAVSIHIRTCREVFF